MVSSVCHSHSVITNKSNISWIIELTMFTTNLTKPESKLIILAKNLLKRITWYWLNHISTHSSLRRTIIIIIITYLYLILFIATVSDPDISSQRRDGHTIRTCKLTRSVSIQTQDIFLASIIVLDFFMDRNHKGTAVYMVIF